MCGIVVFARAPMGRLPDETAIATARDTLAHRGPDDGTLETIDDWVAFGFRRLSIIDVEGARQPLRSEDGQVVCIFNGEIYNFVELRSRLRALGHTFSTNGDGETIVHGYEQWGDAVFERLEGMFAAAVLDRRRRRLVVARDRFGIKPLFYRSDPSGFAAASELKALLSTSPSRPTASRNALVLGAMRMHVPWPLTAFSGVYRLPPGALLVLADGDASPRLRRYARMAVEPTGQSRVEDARDVFEAAIARQMVADVPVGAFLSGGIDSTLIVAVMRTLARQEVHTFSIRTVDHDESDVAANTARVLGTTHHTLDLEAISFDDLAELPRLYDEPFAETSALGVRALSRYARQYVKVALSGDGGDEVFGGYDSYRWIRRAAGLRIPARAPLSRATYHLLQRTWPPAIRRALRGSLLAIAPPAVAQRDVTTLAWAARAADRERSERLSRLIEGRCQLALADIEPTRRAMLADRLERLPNAMLAKVDIASMSASLEVRVPMLDDKVVRFADGLPTSSLLGMRRGKLLLRRMLATFPGIGEIAWHSKRGFTLPLERWMTSPAIRPRMEQLVGDHNATLEALTGANVLPLWTSFLAERSQLSSGTAAMQLLWFATVALWADQLGVRTSVDEPLDPSRIV